MEGVRETPLRGVVIPLRRKSSSPRPKLRVRPVRPVTSGQGEVLELFGERSTELRSVTQVRDRVPPYRLF
jgi:hypothetical protein